MITFLKKHSTMQLLLFTLTLFTGLLTTELTADEVSIEDSMKEKIHSLVMGHSFIYTNLGLTNAELDLFDRLKFDLLPERVSVQYDRFGDLYLLKDELPVFLKSIGNITVDEIDATVEAIQKIVQYVVTASNKNCAWVCVRASTPTNDYDMPRWHIDGAYFGLNYSFPPTECVFKFAVTLKGAPTLLYDLPNDLRDVFTAQKNDRVFLSELLDVKNAESPQIGEGVFFVVADNRIGAVHSEPKMHENRLFLSILVGDESEIDELNQRWHPKATLTN